MPIKQLTPQEQVNRFLYLELKRRERTLIHNLAIIGEECNNRARSTTKASKNFLDHSGNLRSSIGYVIANRGKIVTVANFEVVKNGKEGAIKGEDFAKRLARKYTKSVVLVLVAGMNYAIHVQRKGYDVLTSAELMADDLVPKLLKDLGLEK